MDRRAVFAVVALVGVALSGALLLSSSKRVSAAPTRASAGRAAPTLSPARPLAKATAPRSPQPKGEDTVFARWGGAPGELGRARPPEGNPLGPMSFATDAHGRLLVLDGVNGRVVRREATGSTSSFEIDVRNPEDLAVAADGSTAVLDRHADKAVSVYDPSGKLRGRLPIAGEGLSDTGSVTGVFVDGDDVYVEREHASLIKIGSTRGEPAEPRSEIPGRPSRDGASYLGAGFIEPSAGRVYVSSIVRASGEHRFTRELRLGAPVRAIALLDSDRSGRIHFAANVTREGGDEATLLVCLDPLTGEPDGSAALPANTLPEESFRDLIVLDDGGVLLSLRSESGVYYSRYFCE
jgi:hypothetical protein